MDFAFCTANDKPYQAFEFGKLPPATLEKYRRQLICDECKAPAYFRRASTDGRTACFGGRPHNDGCSLATSEEGSWGANGPDDEDERFNPGDRIIVDLRLEADDSGAPGGTADKRQHGRGRFFGGADGTHRTLMYRRLRSMLRGLITSSGLETSNQYIEVPGIITRQAKHFFVHCDVAGPNHHDKFFGFWGSLTDARRGSNGTIWLNTGGKREPSIPISEEDEQALLQLARAEDLEDLAGAYILVLGKLNSSKHDKPFITNSGPLYLALITQPHK